MEKKEKGKKKIIHGKTGRCEEKHHAKVKKSLKTPQTGRASTNIRWAQHDSQVQKNYKTQKNQNTPQSCWFIN